MRCWLFALPLSRRRLRGLVLTAGLLDTLACDRGTQEPPKRTDAAQADDPAPQAPPATEPTPPPPIAEPETEAAPEPPKPKPAGGISFNASQQPIELANAPVLEGEWLVLRADFDQIELDQQRLGGLGEDGYVMRIPPMHGPYRHLFEPLESAFLAHRDARLLLVVDRRTAFDTFEALIEAGRKAGFEIIALAVVRPDGTLGSLPLHFADPAPAGEPNRGEGRDAPRVVVIENGYELFAAGWSRKTSPKHIELVDPMARVCEFSRWDREALLKLADKQLRPAKSAKVASMWADGEVPIGAVVEAMQVLSSLDCDDSGSHCRFEEIRLQAPQPLTVDESLDEPSIVESMLKMSPGAQMRLQMSDEQPRCDR